MKNTYKTPKEPNQPNLPFKELVEAVIDEETLKLERELEQMREKSKAESYPNYPKYPVNGYGLRTDMGLNK
jgi:hypothetical protein